MVTRSLQEEVRVCLTEFADDGSRDSGLGLGKEVASGMWLLVL